MLTQHQMIVHYIGAAYAPHQRRSNTRPGRFEFQTLFDTRCDTHSLSTSSAFGSTFTIMADQLYSPQTAANANDDTIYMSFGMWNNNSN